MVGKVQVVGVEGGLDVCVVDLVFNNSETDISVHIPSDISSSTMQKFPFTCRRYHETEMVMLRGQKFKSLAKETHPNSLSVTVEQIQNLVIKAGFFEKGRPIGPRVMDSSGRISQQQTVKRSDRVVELEIPEELEIGQTYSLVVTSDDLSLSARLLKEKRANRIEESKKSVKQKEFERRTRNMGAALLEEGMRNLDLAARGGAGVFDSSTTTSDVYAHGMRGIIRAAQQINPEIEVPAAVKPSESSEDLNKLTADILQLRFEKTLIKDKEFEFQRLQAAMSGNIQEMNRITQLELINSQLLIKIVKALEKKGITPQIPQSASFKAAERKAAEALSKSKKNVEEGCKTQ